MALITNSNHNASLAQRNLNQNRSSLKTTLERLSSGMRVNGAADDAAGLSIGTRMSAQVRGLSKAIGNANDAVSLSQTADGAMNEVTQLLQRMRELNVQALSETNTSDDRDTLQAEIEQLKKEVDQVGQLEFNGKRLFGGHFDFQLSDQTEDVAAVSLRTKQLASNRLGTHSSFSSGAVDTTVALATGDVIVKKQDGQAFQIRATDVSDDQLSTANHAGSAIAKAAAINAGSQDHGVTAIVGATTLTSTGITSTQILDEDDVLTINGEQITGFTVVENDADGSLVDAINAVSQETGVIASMNGASQIELIAKDGRNIAIGATNNAANLGFTDGTVQGGTITLEAPDVYTLEFASQSVAVDALGSIAHVSAGLNGIHLSSGEYVNDPPFFFVPDAGVWAAGNPSVSITGSYDSSQSASLGSPEQFYGLFWDTRFFIGSGPSDNDVFGDMIQEVPGYTSGDSVIHVNLNGLNVTLTVDITNVDSDRSDGIVSSFKFQVQDTTGALGSVEAVMGKDPTSNSLASIDITTTTSAARSLRIIDLALEEVNGTRAELGALSNRLESTINNLSQTKDNLSGSKSRIMDADFAAESAQLSQSQIIQQAGTSVLAQANSGLAIVLNLL